jgi:hypothetical protein
MIAKNSINFENASTVLDEELITQTTYVRVSANYSDDVSTFDVMNAVEAAGTLDFWNDPEEDIYSEDDGDPA